MTERLYYTEPSRTEFDAVVERVEPHERGTLVVLDQTAFYPTSGGQPFDTGRLGDARVIDVFDDEAGTVVHLVEGTLAVGQPVHGSIDRARRFDHMQQHSGQHVLSAAFERLHQARTVSFHLGSAVCTIDLAQTVDAAEIRAAEDEANRIVWENMPVTIRFATAAEAAALPLRKESTREGTLRLIAIGDVDLSACGGTHVSQSGAIGVIAIKGWEKFKGGTRVEFVCGRRALQLYREWRDELTETTRLLSVAPAEMAGAVGRLQAEAKEFRRTVRAFQQELAEQRAAGLARTAVDVAGCRLVVAALDGWDAQGLKLVAQAVAAMPGHAAVLVSRPAPAFVVAARAADAALDARRVVETLIQRFGGRGGGRPELAQGGGLTGSIDEILAAARETVGGISAAS